MPVIIVYGVPDSIDREELESLISSLQLEVSWIPKLHLTPDQVSVFFPRDLVQKGLGEEFIVFVKGLFDRPERTMEVRSSLADKISNTCATFFRPYVKKEALVECFVEPFNPTSGFASKTINGTGT